MSFKATVYFNDADIYATKILAKNGVGVTLINETRYYGDAAYETIELADSTMVTFTATPAYGCEFTKWYYRIGGDSGDLEDSEDNPFYYSGTEDIIIRAEGQASSGGGDFSANVDVYDISDTSFSVRLTDLQTDYTLQCIWNVYENPNSDGTGGTLVDADSSSGDCSFSNMTPNTTYRVICYVYNDVTGQRVAILESENFKTTSGGGDPDEPDDGGPLPAPDGTVFTRTGGSSLTKKDFVNLSLPSYTIDIATITFENSGIATFYTTDATVDVYGYLTLVSSGDYDIQAGRPDSWLAEADGYDDEIGLPSDGSNWDFSFSYPVKAGVTYYIAVRAFDGADSGTVTLRVIRPPAIPKWNWGASNGSASVVQTMAAANAVRNKESTKNFSHLVWNDMVDKVKAICDKAVGWWDSESYGLSYANTKAIANSDGEFVLTANMFNTLRNNLEIAGKNLGVGDIPETTDHDNAPSGTIPQPVNSGDKVFGHYFLTLTDYMNSCIDKL